MNNIVFIALQYKKYIRKVIQHGTQTVRIFPRDCIHRQHQRSCKTLKHVPAAAQLSIRQLENELNVKLFDRTSKGVTLTEAGKLLYDRSGNLLEYARSTELEVSKTGKKRILRIGLTPTTVDTIMPYISQFSKKIPT